MGLSRGSLTSQGTDPLIFEKLLTHKNPDAHPHPEPPSWHFPVRQALWRHGATHARQALQNTIASSFVYS